MAEFETKCPHCQCLLSVQEEWIGMEVECPSCKKAFTIQRTGPDQATLSARPPQYNTLPQNSQPQQYGQPQYAPPQYGQPQQYGQPPYAPPQYGQPQVNYGVPFQGIGAQFQMMPGEFMIHQEKMTRVIFPAGATEMRLTNQRLVFCHTSRGLTLFVSWLFWYVGSNKISQIFTRSDIVEMHLENSFFGRKKIAITNVKGETFRYTSNGFSNTAVNTIMQWFFNQPR